MTIEITIRNEQLARVRAMLERRYGSNKPLDVLFAAAVREVVEAEAKRPGEPLSAELDLSILQMP